MDLQNWFLLAVAFLNLILGSVIASKNHRSPIALSYGVFVFFVAAWSLGLAMFRLTTDFSIAILWAKFYYVSAAYIGASFLYFSLVFPDKLSPSKKQIYFILVSAVIMGGLIALPGFLTKEVVGREWGKEVILGNGAYLLFSLYFIGMFGTALYRMFRLYLSRQGLIRSQAVYIFWGVFIAGIFGVFFNLYLPWIGNYKFIWGGPLFTVIMIICIGYAIARYRLLDIRFIISRGILYTILVAVVSGAFGIVTIVASAMFQETTTFQAWTVLVIASILLVVIIDPLKYVLSLATDRFFYKKKIDYGKVLRDISQAIAREIELLPLLKTFTEEVEKKLRISKVDVVHYNEEKKTFSSEKHSGVPQLELFEVLQEHRAAIIIDELKNENLVQGHKKHKEIVEWLETQKIQVLIPVQLEARIIGALFISAKKSRDAFTQEEVESLELLTSQFAVALEKAKLFAEVQTFNIKLQEEVKKATGELQEANEHLQQLDKAKSEFLSIAAHQLRTPLTGIKGYLSMIEAGEIEQKDQGKIIHDLYGQADRLSRVVNVFLNVSRIEAGRLRLDYVKTRLEEVVDSVMMELRAIAQKKKVTVTFHQPEKPTPELFMDQDKIHDVVMNLVDNAIKYNKEGGHVEVSLKVDDSCVAFTTQDDGIGMNASDVTRVFEKFARGEEGFKSHTEGTGLGLFVAKRVVQVHGGDIWAESDGAGKGSRFIFTLPLKLKEKPEESGMQTLVKKELEEADSLEEKKQST